MKNSLSILNVLLFFIAVSCTQPPENDIEEKVTTWINIYNERADFEGFLSLYDSNLVLEDIIFGEKINGLDGLRNFFAWENEQFKNLKDNNIIIEETIISGNKAVIKGHFTRFKWGETAYGPMHFTTLLTFNEAGKISRHVDWINYPSELVDYNSRKDSNDWIK